MQSEVCTRPERILMTTDTIGGVWTYALELSRILAEASVQVILATMGRPLTPTQREWTDQVPNLILQESSYKLEWMEEPWKDISRSSNWLLELEDRFQPNLVHLNSYSFGALPWRSPALVVGHSCVLSWWEAVKRVPAPQEWTRYRREVCRGLQMADQVVAPTEAMLESLKQHYGPIDRGMVVPNGRDPITFQPGSKEPFILAVGRIWDEAKNLAALQVAAPSLQWPVYVAGDSRHPDGGCASTAHVNFLGWLSPEQLASWYGRAAIYVLPARYEPFGLTVLEAALSGCALVLGDIPSLRETWEGAAWFVPPDDTDILTEALKALAADSHRRTTLADNARLRALQYPPKRMARGYLDAYSKCFIR